MSERSNDEGRFDLGVQVLNSQYTFILKFFMYDDVSKEHDYPIARSFGKIYSPTVELVVSFPHQVMLSQKRPPHEVRIDHIKEKEQQFYLPADTYAYTTATPFVMQFDTDVALESFWLRLHRSPKAYIERSEGTRVVRVYQGEHLVAETTFMLTSDEWVLIKPTFSQTSIIGSTLWVEANTDIDSIVTSWGDSVKYYNRMKDLGLSNQALQSFQAWKVSETPENPDSGYTLKMAHIVVTQSQKLKEDRVLLNPEQQKNEYKRRKEEEAQRKLEREKLISEATLNQKKTGIA